MDNYSLLKKVQDTGFAVVEATLYLDAYPDSEKAMQYFHDKTREYDTAVQEYERECGPLKVTGNIKNTWDWVYKPWPWEMGAN